MTWTGASRTSCHAPRMRGIQYAAAYRFNHWRLGNTGQPAGACHLARSSRRRIPLASVAAGLTADRTRLDSINLRQLDTSNGCQNHTLLPYAITPLVLRGSIAYSPKTKPEAALQYLARAGASRPPQ